MDQDSRTSARPEVPDQPQLPFKFFTQRVVETEISLGGTIKHPEVQPARVYTRPGERVVLLVVAYVEGQGTKLADGNGGLTWVNKLNLAEAYEMDAETMEPALEGAREQVRAAAANRTAGATS